MYVRLFCLCLAALASFGQQPLGSVSPDTVVATVNGQKFTVHDFEQLVANMTPQMREAAMKQPRALLEQYALFQNILAEAEKSKLALQTPYKERIEEARRQILVQAQLSHKSDSIVVSPEEVKKAYEENRARYAEARAKVIFISLIKDERSLDGKLQQKREPPESKKLAEDIVTNLKAGGDFVQLAKEHSDDGTTADTGANYPDAINSRSASIPQNIRDAVLKANAGDILGPLQHETGYYIFRIESMGLTPFDQVKNDIFNELKEAGLKKWLDETKSRSTVTIANEEFFSKPPERGRQQ